MLTLCFVILKQNRKPHADISPVHRASDERSKVYPIVFDDGRVPAFSDFGGEERRRERSGLLPSTQATPLQTC